MNPTSQPVRLEIPSVARLMPVVRAALYALAEARPDVRLASEELDEVAVALQEACTNAIRHAHGLDPALLMVVEFEPHADRLVVRVIDRGHPFELTDGEVPEPELLQEGGYGIAIMRAWMDQVTLERDGDTNVLELVRRYRVQEGRGRTDHAPAR